MRKQTLIGCATVVAILLYVVGSGASDRGPPHFGIQDDNRSLVHLAGVQDTRVEGPSALREGSEGTGATVTTGRSLSLKQSNEDGEAYQDAVESFARHYRSTIGHADPLVHEMLMHSEGADSMTKTKVEELGALLSDMGAAPDSEVIGSYPEGYEDCDGYLRAGATSLGLAADSVRGFNETADMEYLRDYRKLVAMYMRATADAQWCVSDRLHLAYP